MTDFISMVNMIATYEGEVGWKEGIEEGNIIESKNIARALIQEGFENDAISDMTKLSVAIIKGLR